MTSKYLFSTAILLVFCLISLNMIEKNYLPEQLNVLPRAFSERPIEIPREARNTITEIPVVRSFDSFTYVSACTVIMGEYR